MDYYHLMRVLEKYFPVVIIKFIRNCLQNVACLHIQQTQ